MRLILKGGLKIRAARNRRNTVYMALLNSVKSKDHDVGR